MRTQQGLFVPNGKDRSEEELKIWGAIPLQIKVSTDDTDGALFVFEHADMGDGRFTLGPGDSLFAPRMVPHGWAYVGEDPGTLLLAVQPAGLLEAFFREGCEMTSLPTPEEADRMFAAHGMKVVGPPLDVD